MSGTTSKRVSGRDRRKNTPVAYLAGAKAAGPVVVCAGDSITAADVSSDWIARLGQRFGQRGWTFVNAGINGNLAWNVLQRLNLVIACQPDAVILFVGTNDVAGTLNARTTEMFRKQQGLPVAPSLDWFAENVDAILARLQSETSASIAVVEIPPLGEQRDSEINNRVHQYNAALREIAGRHGVEVLGLNAPLLCMIPSDHAPAPYEQKTGPMLRSALSHLILRRSWDEISKRNGLVILTDWVHLNDRAADVVARLTGEFLESTARGDSTTGTV